MNPVRVMLAFGAITGLPLGLGAQSRDGAAAAARETPAFPVRNPSFLRASELLSRQEPAGGRRVRFEWEQVGAPEYVLQGQWIEPGSWAARRREVTINARSAGQWDEHLVAVELLLDTGAHSWSVVAVFPGKGLTDFVNPTRLSFDVR